MSVATAAAACSLACRLCRSYCAFLYLLLHVSKFQVLQKKRIIRNFNENERTRKKNAKAEKTVYFVSTNKVYTCSMECWIIIEWFKQFVSMLIAVAIQKFNIFIEKYILIYLKCATHFHDVFATRAHLNKMSNLVFFFRCQKKPNSANIFLVIVVYSFANHNKTYCIQSNECDECVITQH